MNAWENIDYRSWLTRDPVVETVVGYIAGHYSITSSSEGGKVRNALSARQKNKLTRHISYLCLRDQFLLFRDTHHIDRTGLNKETAYAWLQEHDKESLSKTQEDIQKLCSEHRISERWIYAIAYLLFTDQDAMPNFWVPNPLMARLEKGGFGGDEWRAVIYLEADTTLQDVNDMWPFIVGFRNHRVLNPSRKGSKSKDKAPTSQDGFDTDFDRASAEVKRKAVPDPDLRKLIALKDQGKTTKQVLKESGLGAKYSESDLDAFILRQKNDDKSYVLY
jgi:hypothetical protein